MTCVGMPVLAMACLIADRAMVMPPEGSLRSLGQMILQHPGEPW